MNEAAKNWTETWANTWGVQQQALLRAMLSMAKPKGGNEALPSPQPPLQEQFADLQQTWKESLQRWTELVRQGSTPPVLTPDALRELYGPTHWSGQGVFDAGLRHVLEGPKIATLWDLDRKLLELQQSAAERDKAVAAYQAIVQAAWNKAFERFAASAPSGGEAPSTWRGITDRWLSVANEVLIEERRSVAFIQAQTRMLRAASDHRLQERNIAEAWCEAFQVPTRTEMDEMQREVIELRRQVRALQRANAAAGNAASKTEATKPLRATSTAAKQKLHEGKAT